MNKIILTLAALLVASPALAQRTIVKDATDKSIDYLIIDETTGVPETGVVYNTSGIDLWYQRHGSAKQSITETTGGSLTTHVDNTITEIQSGVYEFDAPDAAFASGADYVTFGGTITGMIVKPVTVQLVDASPVVVTAFTGGDLQEDSGSYYFEFTTTINGVPSALTSGAVTASLNSGSDAATGLTLNTVATGRYEVVIDTNNAVFNGGGNLNITLSAGTVAGLAMANTKVGEVSIGRYADINVTNGLAEVNVKQVDDDATAAANAESFFDGTGYAGTGNTIPTVTTAANVTTVNGLAANVITAASIATDAIGASEIAASAIGESEIAADAINASEIGDAAIDAGAIATDAITATEIAADAIGASEIAANAIGASEAAADLGADLVSIPWNAAWDAEAQSEANDALVANNLDHLLLQAITGTDVTDNSAFAKLVSKSATADWDTFNNTTDSLEALADNAGGGGSTGWSDLVADNDDVPGSFGKAIADILVDTGTSIPDAIDNIDVGPTYPPRINFPPSPAFTTQVSRRADGTYKCTKPIRLTAGEVDKVYVFVDMSPLFGPNDFVQEVGSAEFSDGSITQGDDNGPRDTYAVIELSGTADEDCTVTVPVTMVSGTTVPVVFDVEVLE